jgi:hypothetical protein
MIKKRSKKVVQPWESGCILKKKNGCLDDPIPYAWECLR